jgi:hypothetical protein
LEGIIKKLEVFGREVGSNTGNVGRNQVKSGTIRASPFISKQK